MQVFKIAVLLLVCATHLSIAEETLTYSTQQRDNIYDFWITYKGTDLKDVVGNFRIFHTDADQDYEASLTFEYYYAGGN